MSNEIKLQKDLPTLVGIYISEWSETLDLENILGYWVINCSEWTYLSFTRSDLFILNRVSVRDPLETYLSVYNINFLVR